jgi:hypothetical protein
MALAPLGGGGSSPTAYELIGAISTYRNGPNQTLIPIEEISARSLLYDVSFTFDVTMTTFQGSGAQELASEKTGYVNAIGAMDHVVGLRGEQDTANDGNVYNYLVITVGTDDGLITTDVRLRMDHLGTGQEATLVDNAWTNLQALGA